MKILFVTPLNDTNLVETTFPHLGLGYLASSLRRQVPDVEFKVTATNVDQAIREWKPDLVGLTSVSQYWSQAVAYAAICHMAKVPVIAGGIHVSTIPETLDRNMDIGVIGEGEDTFVDLIKGWRKDRTLHHVAGTVFHTAAGPRPAPARPPVKDLDKLAFPDRGFQEMREHTSMFTSRGCPYRCPFCASTRYFSSKARFFSAEYVVEEIALLQEKYHVNRISFLDDLFIASRSRLENIYELLGKRDLIGRLRYICNVRSNLVDDDLCRLLTDIGVDTVGIGMESAHPKTLAYLKGQGNISVGDHLRALELLRKYRITAHPSFIIGSPQETREEILTTFRFIKENKVPDFEVYVLMPFPGTPVWDAAQARGLVGPDMDWNRLRYTCFDFGPGSIVVSETLGYEELRELYLMFTGIRQRVRLHKLVIQGLRHPIRGARFVARKLTA